MNTVEVKNKVTGEIKIAVYASTPTGKMRYHIDGNPLSDKRFDSEFKIIKK